MSKRDHSGGPVRVAFFVTHAELGGLQRSVSDLLGRLDPERSEALVVCSFAGPWLERLREAGQRTLLVEMPRRLMKLSGRGVAAGADPRWQLWRAAGFAWRAIPYAYRLGRQFRRAGVEIVYNTSARSQLLGGLAARFAGIPAVWHIHHEVRDSAVHRLCARFASSAIVLSRAVAAQAAGFLEARKLAVIYNGVEVERFRGAAGSSLRRELAIPEGDPLLGMVGWLAPHKGQRYFLEAAALVRRKLPRARFVVVGEEPFDGGGGYARQLAAQGRSLRLGESLHFLGKREDIPEIMAALDVLAVPSLSEGFGRVAIEAMAAGKPVVGTRVGGIPEAVVHGETGLLVPPRDPVSLAGAMTWLLQHPERAGEMGEAGRERVRRLFSLDNTVRETERLLARVLAERGRPELLGGRA
jgi:glycosyltransferase involved in cell wall biosynthesis